MFLSRVAIDTNNRQKIRDLTHLGAYHAWVEQSFPEEVSSGVRSRKLWRIDRIKHQDFLLIVSQQKPNIQCLEKYGVIGTGQTRDYDTFLNTLEINQVMRFRATLNPIKSIHTDNDQQKRGKVVPHITVEQQLNFLFDQSIKHGFKVEADQVVITERKFEPLKKRHRDSVKISKVTYEGVLTITDLELFREVLINGLGKKKAYGCGLITVIPGE
jgi:CRISPR system Cascade subunit CasE